METLSKQLEFLCSELDIIPAQVRAQLIDYSLCFQIVSLKSVLKLFLLFFPLVVLSGCMSIVYYEGSYHGKVIDYETHEPIEGAVVLSVWSKGYMGAGGIVHEYYDTFETVTDEQGEFTIKGMGLRAMTHLEKMDMVIFKAGYGDVGASWEYLKKSKSYRDRIKWEGDKAIIPLDKWTLEQRRNRFSIRPAGLPNDKQKRLLEEIKKEDNEIR